MNVSQFQWLKSVIAQAKAAGHIFPEMAASEAALESAWGTSALAREGNNLFGMKQHQHPLYGTLILPTKEWLNSQWVEVDASWIKYETMAECFEDRMETLERLKGNYPHYAAALSATDPVTYIYEVSKNWSTDPTRAMKVLGIFNSYTAMDAQPASNAEQVRDAATGEN